MLYAVLINLTKNMINQIQAGNIRINIILRRIRDTTVAVVKQKVLHILSVCL